MATRNDSAPSAGRTIQAGTASRPRDRNAVEAGRNRSSTDRRTTAAAETDSAQRRLENSIQPTKRPPKAADAPSRPKQRREARDADGQSAASEPGRGPGGQGASSAKAAPERKRLVPEHIAKRFVQVGKHYYFADGARAFTDRGGRLTTKSENTEVSRRLVAIAQARGWKEITVRGTERFRKDAWFAARLAGLEVQGYRPSKFERAHLVRTITRDRGGMTKGAAGNAPTGVEPREQSPATEARKEGSAARGTRQRGGLLTGKLVDHGRATYRHDPREPMSYFVKIETPQGDRTIWGVDLERAMKESLTRPQIGGDVGLRAVRQDAVKVRSHEWDAEGK